MSGQIVAVLGATGAVGRVMLDILAERKFPIGELRAIATERSRGRVLPFGDSTVVAETIDERGFEGVDLVLVDTPDEVAEDLVPKAVAGGAVAIDNSAAFRLDPEVPLVVPEINPGDAQSHKGILASPNCTTITMVLPLQALHQKFGLTRVVASSYQSVSGAGRPGVDELSEQAVKLSHHIDELAAGKIEGLIPEPVVFPAPVAFNVIPRVGSEKDMGYTGEEWKLLEESRKILGLPDLKVTGTCVRVPSVAGHGIATHATFENEINIDQAKEAIRQMAGVELTELPTTLMAAGSDECFVGRVRRDPHDSRALWFFATCDNLRKGAALNTVQIAELLDR